STAANRSEIDHVRALLCHFGTFRPRLNRRSQAPCRGITAAFAAITPAKRNPDFPVFLSFQRSFHPGLPPFLDRLSPAAVPKGPIVASKKRNPARARRKFVNGAKSRRATAQGPEHDPIDHGAILQSVGEAPYEWRIDNDVLTWGRNAAQVLGIRDAALIANGRAYANLLDPGNAQT